MSNELLYLSDSISTCYLMNVCLTVEPMRDILDHSDCHLVNQENKYRHLQLDSFPVQLRARLALDSNFVTVA